MRLKQILIAIDQLANAMIGGWADETLSSRAWRENRMRLVAFIDCLFFWEKNHCKATGDNGFKVANRLGTRHQLRRHQGAEA